jgi:RecB family exonuclease
VRRFEELLEAALGGAFADVDRGAERQLLQTRFLAAAFRHYERLVKESGACDEHSLRERLLAEPADVGLRHVIVTVADWIGDPHGLFVADFDLLARLPGLSALDLVCTEAVLGSGFHERLHGWWPGIEEEDDAERQGIASVAPRLYTPRLEPGAPETLWFTYRDREEELIAVAGRVRRSADIDLNRIGVVFNRPLPYLYLAPDTLGAAGLPFQSSDTLPLAAEPTASAIDLVLDAVETNFTRPALVALLRSPHLRLAETDPTAAAIAAFDRALADARYLGEVANLEAFDHVPDLAEPALNVVLNAARDLVPLLGKAPASIQIQRLHGFLTARFRPLADGDPLAARERSARAAILEILGGLARAHATYHDPPWSIQDLAASVRRAIGEQTFLPTSDEQGIQLLDDQAARYADLDDLTVVGLVENEWPARPRRNIFYSSSVLKSLGWASEKDRRAADSARFLDLIASAARSVVLSTFTLDDEALIARSTLLDELPRARLSAVRDEECVRSEDEAPGAPHLEAGREWAAIRHGRLPPSDACFHGSLGSLAPRTWSVSALETYLDCPFKFFAQHVLRLHEEPDDEEVMDPRRQGQFVHEVFERFFRTWQDAGHLAITSANLHDARLLFADVVERALGRLPDAEAGLERTRLLGSSAAAGLGEAVFRMEAERPIAVIKRLLEHRLDGSFTITTEAGARVVSLRGKADRLDLLADGTFRLIDYKLGWPPNRSRALQLPIYGLAAAQLLAQPDRRWTLGEAAYLAFKGPKRVVPLFNSLEERDEVLARAQQRLADTLDAIERGEFPPHPDDVYRCETCSFAAVCRRDYVGDI